MVIYRHKDKDRIKLLEAIPNKITDTMGIVADVNLLYDNELQYIEIIVDKYLRPSAIMSKVVILSQLSEKK